MSVRRNSTPETTASQQRVAAKERSRAEDAAALASGQKTRERLRAENSHFRRIAHEPIQWDKTKRLS